MLRWLPHPQNPTYWEILYWIPETGPGSILGKYWYVQDDEKLYFSYLDEISGSMNLYKPPREDPITFKMLSRSLVETIHNNFNNNRS